MSEAGLTAGDLPSPGEFGAFHPFIKGVFSQWAATPFVLDDQVWSCAEQWMMVAKARLFGDEETAAAMLGSADPAIHKRLGQTIKAFEQSIWDAAKIDIVYRGNLAKFTQNPGAGRQLAVTAPAMLIEANPRDWVWGCGWAIDDPRAVDPGQWRGENLLGRILTKVRDETVKSSPV